MGGICCREKYSRLCRASACVAFCGILSPSVCVDSPEVFAEKDRCPHKASAKFHNLNPVPEAFRLRRFLFKRPHSYASIQNLNISEAGGSQNQGRFIAAQ